MKYLMKLIYVRTSPRSLHCPPIMVILVLLYLVHKQEEQENETVSISYASLPPRPSSAMTPRVHSHTHDTLVCLPHIKENASAKTPNSSMYDVSKGAIMYFGNRPVLVQNLGFHQAKMVCNNCIPMNYIANFQQCVCVPQRLFVAIKQYKKTVTGSQIL